MMSLHEWVRKGRELGASALHIEAETLPVARIRGELAVVGPPIAGNVLVESCRELLGADGCAQLDLDELAKRVEQRSR